MSRQLPSSAHALFLNLLPGFAKHSCVYLDPPRGSKTNSCLPGISVNKTCCKNTVFCHCNMRQLNAAIHVMFQYSQTAAERNKFEKIAAVWLKVDWEQRFVLQRHWL